MDPDSVWLSVAEAARYTKSAPDTVRRAAQREELRGVQRTAPKGRWRFHRQDLDAWVRGERPRLRPAS